jgi:hypothetical protein
MSVPRKQKISGGNFRASDYITGFGFDTPKKGGFQPAR